MTREKNHTKTSLQKCGYPEWVFSENQKKHNEQDGGSDNIKGRGHKAWITIPYIRGISENIKNILKEHGITAFYKPQNTLQQQLVKTDSHLKSVPTLYMVLSVEGKAVPKPMWETLFSPSEPG